MNSKFNISLPWPELGALGSGWIGTVLLFIIPITLFFFSPGPLILHSWHTPGTNILACYSTEDVSPYNPLPLNKTSNFHLSPKHKSLTITKFITQAERSSSKFRELYIQKNIVTFLCDCACVFGVDPSHGCVYVQICLLSKDIKRRGGNFILNIARNAQVCEQDTEIFLHCLMNAVF